MSVYCACGSGLPREPQVDGYGIFLTFTCAACEAEKLAQFRPDIFEHYHHDEPLEEDE